MPKLWKWNGKGMYAWELQVLSLVLLWAHSGHQWSEKSSSKNIGKLAWFTDPYWARGLGWKQWWKNITKDIAFAKIPIGYDVEAFGWCIQLRTDKKKWRHPRKFIGPVSWYKL